MPAASTTLRPTHFLTVRSGSITPQDAPTGDTEAVPTGCQTLDANVSTIKWPKYVPTHVPAFALAYASSSVSVVALRYSPKGSTMYPSNAFEPAKRCAALSAYVMTYLSKGEPSRLGFMAGCAKGSVDLRDTLPRACGDTTFVTMLMYFWPATAVCPLTRPC
jgi:hypothetical protein